MDTMEFLDLVWGTEECYVDVPSKIGGHWIPANVEWPEDRGMIARRIRSSVQDEEDVYFSVARFSSKGRRLVDVMPTHWLWADLDKVDPVFLDEDHVLPTLAWESSNGRFQCLWRLAKEMQPTKQTILCRRLTRAIGADKGGFDLTQVLRPPGTKNFKYDPPADVELLWYDPSLVYGIRDMADRVLAIEASNGVEERAAERRSAAVDMARVPARARRLLNTPASMVVTGERSAKLWELECLLLEAGFEVDEVIDLVEPSAWNKHKEVSNATESLRREVEKAAGHVRKKAPSDRESARLDRGQSGRVGDGTESSPRSASPRHAAGEPHVRTESPFVDYATFLGTHIATPRWLIKDIWSAASHGIVGGEPKTSKSTFAMAMGLAVATGTPFLGEFEVPHAGPVLMVQEENAPWVMQDRLRKLAAHAGLINPQGVEVSVAPRGSIMEHVVRLDFPKEAPFKLLNNYGFDLTDDEDLAMLEEEVRREGAAMIILDPLYLLLGGTNVNSQHELGPLMQWLMALRYNHDCAVVLVHHWHKATENSKLRRPGQRLMGSGLLHGWVESGIYMEAKGTGAYIDGDHHSLDVRIEREFRNVAPQGPLDVSWLLGEPGGLDMAVKVSEMTAATVMDQFLEVMGGEEAMSVKALAEKLEMSRNAVKALAVKAGYTVEGKKQGTGTAYWVRSNEGGSNGGSEGDSSE